MEDTSAPKKPFYKNKWFWMVAVVFLILWIPGEEKGTIDGARAPSDTTTAGISAHATVDGTPIESIVVVETPEMKATAYLEKIERERSGLDRLEPGKEGSTKEQLMIDLALLATYAGMLEESKGLALAPEQVAKVKEFAKALSRKQVQAFPRIRKAYVKSIEHDMWLNNIEVSTRGTGSKTIRFVAGVFANNANKEQFDKQIGATLLQFRFSRSEYLWYKGDDSYTYYTRKPLDDGVPAVFVGEYLRAAEWE